MEAISKFLKEDSTQQLVLLNPRMDQTIQDKMHKVVETISLSSVHLSQSHLWICSSGSSGNGPKLIALSKPALFASAKAANKHLHVNTKDRWMNVLPTFHVGGFGVLARAFLSQSEVIDIEHNINSTENKWDPINFVRILKEHEITITSLVPTQVFDLVKLKLECPTRMRAIVVGGGGISDSLLKEAVQLGWPLLKSYGMTECCSQVATSHLVERGQVCGAPAKLSHIEWMINAKGNLAIKSPSLLSGYFQFNSDLTQTEWVMPVENGWYHTNDKVEIEDDLLYFKGRADEVVKVNGELVNIQSLNQKWYEFIMANQLNPLSSVIIDLQDERTTNSIHLIIDRSCFRDEEINILKERFQLFIEKFNKTVIPFERVTSIHFTDEIPRSSLGKVKTSELKNKFITLK